MTKVQLGLLPQRVAHSHKGTYGHLFVLAGAKGYSGAAALCSQAAMRTGAGLVSLGTPADIHTIVAIKLTEVMAKPLPCSDEGVLNIRALEPIQELLKEKTAAVIGPGLSQNPATRELLFNFLPKLTLPTVLDADALNCLSQDALVFKKIQDKPFILTPHPKEMARLLKWSTSDVQDNREDAAELLAKKWNLWVVLKGHGTVVAGPQGQMYINETGNPGMATAGTGDVLAGMIGALLAQNLSLEHAATLGVYLHGAAADAAAKEVGEIGLIASDIVDRIPLTLRAYAGVAQG